MTTPFKMVSYIGSIIPALIGCSVLLGYIIQNQTLKSIFPGLVAMNPATAIALIFSSISLFLANREKTNTMLFRIGLVCAVLVALVGFIKIGGIIIAQDVYIDSHLFIEQLNTQVQTINYLSRIAPTTAISFFFIGISLLLLYKSKKEWLAQLLSTGTFFIAFLAILGYLYGVVNLIGFTAYIPMAVNTAVALAVLSFGVLFLRPNRGLMSTVTSENAGGVLIRKIIPSTIITSTLLGFLGLVTERAGIFTNELGLSLIIIVNIIVFTVFIWWIATRLNDTATKLKESSTTLEQKVVERTAKLSEKTQEAEDSQKAVLNVLEDLNSERTKLQAAKAKDEAMLASIGDGLVVVDRDLKTMLINKAAEVATGWSNDEVFGKIWPEVIALATEDGKPVPQREGPLFIAINAKKTTTTTTTTYLYTRKDKTKFLVAITASPVIVGNELIGAILVFRDITHEREIDKAKTEFVSLASHQLRTPLSTVNWYAEMLLSGDVGKVNPQQKKYLDEVYRSNQRMVVLVNALLNVSRLELGTFTVEPKPIDVVKLAGEAIKEQGSAIKEHKLVLKENYEAGLPKINVDPKLLYMVFQNLLSNAIKYTPEKGKTEFSVKKDGDQILISVADTGYGIPKNQQDKIFTKLFRADNVQEKDTEGTGLGLYIVKSVIEHSGGKVWFESEENKGTTFYVTLPLEGMKRKVSTKLLS